MRFDIDRATIVLVIFVILIVAIFGINQFVQSQPPFEISVVVDPLAEDWIMDAAQQYNNSNAIINNTVRVQVTIQVSDDLDVWRGNPGWNSQNHPIGWIPSSSISLDFAPSGLPFEVLDASLAYTPLVWGGFQNRVAVITEDSTQAFDWASAQAVADNSSWSDGGFVNMAINWPSSSMAGLGAISSAVATYQNSAEITRSTLTDSSFSTWFQAIEDSVLNSERLGGNPAQAMASRGSSAADFALLTESQWLTQVNSLSSSGFVFAYADYQFPLDFPIALWSDTQTTANERAALQSFANYLSANEQIALAHGLRPTGTVLDSNATLFTQAAPYGILLEVPVTQTISNIDRGTADALILLVD